MCHDRLIQTFHDYVYVGDKIPLRALQVLEGCSNASVRVILSVVAHNKRCLG